MAGSQATDLGAKANFLRALKVKEKRRVLAPRLSPSYDTRPLARTGTATFELRCAAGAHTNQKSGKKRSGLVHGGSASLTT